MNGRNVVQVLRQRRQYRVRRLAVTTMFYQEKAYRGDQKCRNCRQLLEAKGKSKYRLLYFFNHDQQASERLNCLLYLNVHFSSFILIFYSPDEDRECCTCFVSQCGCRSSGYFQNSAMCSSRVLDRYAFVNDNDHCINNLICFFIKCVVFLN